MCIDILELPYRRVRKCESLCVSIEVFIVWRLFAKGG